MHTGVRSTLVLNDYKYDTYWDDMSYLWIMDESMFYAVLMSYAGLDATLCSFQMFYYETYMANVPVHFVHAKWPQPVPDVPKLFLNS